MKKVMLIAMVLLIFLAGCMAEVQYENLNSGAKIKYTRWGDQKIEGLVVDTPDGVHVELNKQESDTKVLAEVLKLGIAVGSGALLPAPVPPAP